MALDIIRDVYCHQNPDIKFRIRILPIQKLEIKKQISEYPLKSIEIGICH